MCTGFKKAVSSNVDLKAILDTVSEYYALKIAISYGFIVMQLGSKVGKVHVWETSMRRGFGLGCFLGTLGLNN